MSQDVLGPVVRALVGVPREYLGTVRDAVNRLNDQDVGKAARFAHDLKTLLRGELSVSEPKLLAPQGATTVTLAEDLDPDKFFRTCSGLWVSDDFRSLVVAKAQPSKTGTSHAVRYAKLAKDATDEEIEGGLPTDHLWNETAICAVIAGLIEQQPNGVSGVSGVLLNNECTTLFYLGSCVVPVSWSADYRRWGIGAWGRGRRGWYAGDQVFSPATEI